MTIGHINHDKSNESLYDRAMSKLIQDMRSLVHKKRQKLRSLSNKKYGISIKKWHEVMFR